MEMHAGINYLFEFLGHSEVSLAIARSQARVHSATGREQLEIGPMIDSKLSRICRVWALFSRLPAPTVQTIAGAGLFLAALCVCTPLAQAQAIVATVNDTPITNIDVE